MPTSKMECQLPQLQTDAHICLSIVNDPPGEGVTGSKWNLMSQLIYNTVWVKKSPPPRNLLTFFPKQLGIFSPNFTCLLYVHIYIGLQIFIQLSATSTKLCHIKCNDPVHITCSKCPPSTETHAGWSHLIWHNFIKVEDNWTKFSFCRMCECLIGM